LAKLAVAAQDSAAEESLTGGTVIVYGTGGNKTARVVGNLVIPDADGDRPMFIPRVPQLAAELFELRAENAWLRKVVKGRNTEMEWLWKQFWSWEGVIGSVEPDEVLAPAGLLGAVPESGERRL